jgi:hypothetical protein
MAIPRIACCALIAVLFGVCTATAGAAPVLVIGKDGKVREHRHSLAPATTFPPVRAVRAGALQRRAALASAAGSKRTVRGELKKMLAAGQLDQASYAERRSAFDDAKRIVRKLKGRRKVELRAVVRTLMGIAARGDLTPSRVAPLWLTLQRNV